MELMYSMFSEIFKNRLKMFTIIRKLLLTKMNDNFKLGLEKNFKCLYPLKKINQI